MEYTNLPDCGIEMPTTTAACLRETAEWLDLADKAFAKLATIQGKDLVLSDQIQRHLRQLAEWFLDHPELDAEAFLTMQVEGELRHDRC